MAPSTSAWRAVSSASACVSISPGAACAIRSQISGNAWRKFFRSGNGRAQLLEQVAPAGLVPAASCLEQWHAVFPCKGESAGIRNVRGDTRAFGERNMLRLDERGHQTQIVVNRIAVGEFAQARRARREYFGLAGQADARNRSLGQGLDLAGLKYALQGGR